MERLDALIALLEGTERLSNKLLRDLSGISLSEVRSAQTEWHNAVVARRRSLVAQLSTLAYENVDFSFTAVFLHALDDPDALVRTTAVEALWEEEGVTFLERLQDLVTLDPSPDVRAAAATALGRFSLLAATGRLRDRNAEGVRNTLRNVLVTSADDSAQRLRAVESLAYLHPEPLVDEHICRLYAGDEDERASALLAMGRTMNDKWVPNVLDSLESDEARLRAQAARAAGDMELVEAAPLLRRLLSDDDRDVVQTAIWALGQIGTPAATQVLKDALEDADDELAEALEEALGEAMYAGDYE